MTGTSHQLKLRERKRLLPSNANHHLLAMTMEFAVIRYQTEEAAQRAILQGFERDMDQLAALQLHPDAQTDRHSCLIHLIPEQKMREWAARCKRDHDQFDKKVDWCWCTL